MKLLLDTCTFLWLIAAEHKLSHEVRELLEDGRNTLLLHQASAWEIQLKHQKGHLGLSESPKRIISEGLRLHQITYTPLQDDAIWHLQKLPDIHKDPFDRILIAHALIEGWKLVTPDPQIAKYPVPVVW
ncbi:MAG: type II toxin-antitoxin system VapC family toxin [Puniceicoccaceae bacterium]|nr:MAG: type II toxin-antitoxin system VapC family toxin [Puniceicoccaceae bacterium]